MNDDSFSQSQEEGLPPQVDLAPTSESSSAGPALSWKVALAAAAGLIVVILAYPLFQQWASSSQPAADRPPDEAQSVINTPQETRSQADPDSAEVQFELGNSHVQAGRWSEAVTAYQQAIELDPGLQAAYANLGVAYYQLGEFDRAASQYKKALELDPEDIEVAYNLGALYLQQALSAEGQYDPELLEQAITQLENVNEQAPDLAEPYFSLGVAYSILNQNDRAIEAFEAFLARDSGQDPRASQQAERYLETLRGE